MLDIQQFPELMIHQEVEHLEVFTGFETENRYSVSTPEGEQLLYAFEESGMLGRMFLKSHRGLDLHFVDNDGEPFLTASRSFFWFYSHLHVIDSDGRPIGSLRRRFGVLKRKFELEDGQGRPVGEVQGPMLRPNTFMFYKNNSEIARVTKQWSGIFREGFTDADTFRVQFDHSRMDQDFAHLVLATALAIDLDFFESK